MVNGVYTKTITDSASCYKKYEAGDGRKFAGALFTASSAKNYTLYGEILAATRHTKITINEQI